MTSSGETNTIPNHEAGKKRRHAAQPKPDYLTVNGEEYFSVEIAADKLKLHRDTVVRMAKNKLIGGQKIGRYWRFRECDLTPRAQI